MAYTSTTSFPKPVAYQRYQGGTQYGRNMGGGLSPGHTQRNAIYHQPDPPGTYREPNGKIVYTSNKRKSKPAPQKDGYLALMEKAIGAMTPQKQDPSLGNKLLELLGGGGTGGSAGRGQPAAGPRNIFSRTGTPRQGGFGGSTNFGHDQIPNYIGSHQQQNQPIQQFLPHWATDQAMNDIYAKGAMRGAPQTHMTQLAGSRGLDYGSPMYAASAVKNHAMQASQAARAATDTDFQDHMERAKFDIRHALARNQDVLQGAQNQALRDAMYNQGQGQYFNQILGLIGGLV